MESVCIGMDCIDMDCMDCMEDCMDCMDWRGRGVLAHFGGGWGAIRRYYYQPCFIYHLRTCHNDDENRLKHKNPSQ